MGTQKQAEAVVAVLASRESPHEERSFGWSYATEMDDFTRMLPFMVGAFNAIDRDCDEVISREEFNVWLQSPLLEHHIEGSNWSTADLQTVEASLPAQCKRGLDSPDGLVNMMRRVRALHFEDGGRSSISLQDFVHMMMKVTVEVRKNEAQ